jgi:hypothetical protein
MHHVVNWRVFAVSDASGSEVVCLCFMLMHRVVEWSRLSFDFEHQSVNYLPFFLSFSLPVHLRVFFVFFRQSLSCPSLFWGVP